MGELARALVVAFDEFLDEDDDGSWLSISAAVSTIKDERLLSSVNGRPTPFVLVSPLRIAVEITSLGVFFLFLLLLVGAMLNPKIDVFIKFLKFERFQVKQENSIE